MARVLGIAFSFQVPAVVTVALLLHRHVDLSPVHAGAVSAGLFLAALMILANRLVYWLDDARAPWWRTWLLEVPYAVVGSGCFLAAVPGWLTLVAWAVTRAFDPLAVLGPVHLVAAALGAWGTYVGRVVPVVKTAEVPIESLPAALDGFRIAQLSDVHCGPYVPRWMYRLWARRASALDADVIALTGDLITTGEGYLDDVEDFVRSLRAKSGVVACMGNHDYFHAEGVADAVIRGGAVMLRNESRPMPGAEGLWVAGLDDRWTQRDDLAAALRDVPAGAPVVMLAHDPQSFPTIAARHVALTLSGHTHAGQFGIPWIRQVNMGRLLTRYTAGLYRAGASWIYVNQGVGTTGVPTRVGMRAEISVVVLRRAAS